MQEPLELAFGHAVAQFGATRPEAAEFALTQPTPHGFRRRPQPFGYFTDCKESLFIHVCRRNWVQHRRRHPSQRRDR